MQPVNSQVRSIFPKFNEPFEGRLNFMYLDQKGLVTTGVGNLIDPLPAALSLKWYRADMQPATPGEITAAWNTVKARQDLRMQGGGIYRTVTTLRLTEASIDALILSRMDQNAATITAHHPGFPTWPADAQLAVLSMAWAMGPLFRFPKFWALMDEGDFIAAAAESGITAPKGSTIVKRNIVTKLLLVNAARTKDPGTLSWPKVLGL